MENKNPLKKDPQYLFSGLNGLIIGMGFEGILQKFRTPFEEWLKKSGKKVSDIKPEELYEYNPKLDVRVIQQNDGDGPYSINQTFDDYFIQYVYRERQEILDTLSRIAYDPGSYDSLEIRMRYFLKELPTFQIQSKERNWEPLTEKSLNYIDETLNEIRDYICSKLDLEKKHKLSTGETKKDIKKQPPGLIVSPWAVRNPAKIKKLYTALRKTYIKDETDRSNVFLQFLCGETIPAKENRIKWSNQRALKYFIEKLEALELIIPQKDTEDIIFKFPREKWQLVNEYFVQENGREFKYISGEKTPVSVRKHQKPINQMLEKLE